MKVYCLAMHAVYRCRQTGVCCRAAWDVPVESGRLPALQAAVADGRLPRDPSPFVDAGPTGTLLAHGDAGACVFHDAGSRECLVHARLGVDALPLACRVFPRIALWDARGIRITLSHFCPTAASLLWNDDHPLAIVADPPAFPAADYDGLDARTEWPPLVRPGLLADFEGYDAWESHVVRCLAESDTPDAAMDLLRGDATALARWRPGGPSLRAAVQQLPGDPVPAAATDALRYEEVRAAIPAELRPGLDPAPYPALDAPPFSAATRRFLAAHAFASWCAYQGAGVRTLVRSLEAALAVVRVEAARLLRQSTGPLDRPLLTEAFRLADLRLRHQASAGGLVRAWSHAETERAGG